MKILITPCYFKVIVEFAKFKKSENCNSCKFSVEMISSD